MVPIRFTSTVRRSGLTGGPSGSDSLSTRARAMLRHQAGITLKSIKIVFADDSCVGDDNITALVRRCKHRCFEDGHLIVPIADVTLDELSFANRISSSSLLAQGCTSPGIGLPSQTLNHLTASSFVEICYGDECTSSAKSAREDTHGAWNTHPALAKPST